MRRERGAALLVRVSWSYVLLGCWRVDSVRRLALRPMRCETALWCHGTLRGEAHFLHASDAARGLMCVPIGDTGNGPQL